MLFVFRYPGYRVISNTSVIQSARKGWQKNQALDVLNDVYFLSRTDFLVCTLTSNVK